MRLLGLDFETTGLDPKSDRVIEIGAVLWDTDEQKPLAIASEMISGPSPSEEITRITGIKKTHLDTYGIGSSLAFARLLGMFEHADAVVAHNAPFDRGFLEQECQRHGLEMPKVLWIDTSVDVPYPPHVQTRKLTHLAADHGFANPFAHRAAFDVLTMLKILACYSTEQVVALAKEPNVTLVAQTTQPWHDGGKSNEAAKARGYRWDGALKVWKKNVKKSQVAAELVAKEFRVEEMSA